MKQFYTKCEDLKNLTRQGILIPHNPRTNDYYTGFHSTRGLAKLHQARNLNISQPQGSNHYYCYHHYRYYYYHYYYYCYHHHYCFLLYYYYYLSL